MDVTYIEGCVRYGYFKYYKDFYRIWRRTSSLDLQAEFPNAKGFSARNLWFMKQWYTFYASANEAAFLISNLEKKIDTSSLKLKQVASEIQEPKLKQLDSELLFPSVFAFVPWMHHVLIVQRGIGEDRDI